MSLWGGVGGWDGERKRERESEREREREMYYAEVNLFPSLKH
jgi:hypothetical protein